MWGVLLRGSLFSLLIVGLAGEADAIEATDATRQELREIMAEVDFVPAYGKDNPLCQAFFEDFKKQSNIEHVKPLLVTHDYVDPAFRKYLKHCPKMELRTPVSGRSGGYIGTPTLRLYTVDIDNDPNNGEEFLYFESAFWRKHTVSGHYATDGTSYRLLDLKYCAILARLHVGASRIYPLDTDLSRKQPDTSYHDVIKYRGKHYVYNLISRQGYSRPFTLYGYGNQRRRFSPICSFTR